jgi:hypothetical protein
MFDGGFGMHIAMASGWCCSGHLGQTQLEATSICISSQPRLAQHQDIAQSIQTDWE